MDHCFFLMFINNSVNEIGSCIRLFADDTSVFIIVDDHVSSSERLNADLIKILQLAESWLVIPNQNKAESSHKINKPIHSYLQLGLFLSNDGSWHHQIKFILERAWCMVNRMRKLKFQLDQKSLEITYTAFLTFT